MKKATVLITGMSGLIGGIARRQLEKHYRLRALNRRAVEGVTCHRADISDLDAITSAFEGVDAVVHLAAIAQGDASWSEVLHHNVSGTYNVFEAARKAGVGRVIFASSGATVSAWEREMPYRAIVEGRYQEVESWDKLKVDYPPRPAGLYGCSKVWGETLARHYSDTWGISMICLRIGAVNRGDRPRNPREYSVWCSHRDIARMIQHCLEAPEGLKFGNYFVVSDNRWSYRSMANARREIGFEPLDQAERHRPDS